MHKNSGLISWYFLFELLRPVSDMCQGRALWNSSVFLGDPCTGFVFWVKCHCLVAGCREKLVQPQMGTAPFNRNFTLKWSGCKMPKACLFGVNNVSSSFDRCKEATGFVWNMYHWIENRELFSNWHLEKRGITKFKFPTGTVLLSMLGSTSPGPGPEFALWGRGCPGCACTV